VDTLRVGSAASVAIDPFFLFPLTRTNNQTINETRRDEFDAQAVGDVDD